ncbi:hypothetical protein [Williamwhitmania taraxaci]|uniref:Uncharacterized protein n=1 Tax=Williamwhitmania taraxaci TaxID=1640674 RepID=A0A1G6LX61_9BACT|nr:hypothetical protein [Williamwhitmania taraxaci]SDC47306.1 hypothetical protein SAMN05216323_10335 [Williamwhitmania taraxaci]
MKKFTYSALLLAGAMMLSAASMAQLKADFSAIAVQGDLTYVTLGKAVPVYATPDPIYHPSWAAGVTTPTANLTVGFTWTFTVAPADLGKVTLSQVPANLNYVQITGVTLGGPYAINVKEIAPAAFGGCSDLGINFNVQVTGVPTAAMTGGLVAPWLVDAPTATGTHAHICGNTAAENLSVAFTEAGVPAATLASYAYFVQKRIVNIDVADVEDVPSIVLSTLADRTTTAKYKATSGFEVISTGPLNVLANKRTKYTFTISKASNLPGTTADGIVSGISQKSDYVAANGVPTLTQITTYPFTAGSTTVEYIVNPSPVTGPVYHISNIFAY